MRILITGGAGFIGSHTADALVAAGHAVRVLDRLDAQVHGPGRQWPAYLHPAVERMRGDVGDPAALDRALADVEAVFHLAAATGVGQSMVHIGDYFQANVQATAALLDQLASRTGQVRRLVLASSRAVYGEGACRCPNCGVVTPEERSPAQLAAKRWEVACPACGSPAEPIPTSEARPPQPASMYAITKLTQEQMCLVFGRAYGVPVVALRYFNVYGARQSFANPYTGILTTFLTRLLTGRAPEVYEDGQMTRDLVHVSDVVQANLRALESEGAVGGVFNVGTGTSTRIGDLARLLCERVRPELAPEVVGVARVGDIRHCTADLAQARSGLGYEPRVPVQVGIEDVIGDARRQAELLDRSDVPRRELADAGLLR